MNKLHRDLEHRWFAGVCAGLANQAGIPRWLMRLLWVLCTPPSIGLSIIVYIACAVLIPTESEGEEKPETNSAK